MSWMSIANRRGTLQTQLQSSSTELAGDKWRVLPFSQTGETQTGGRRHARDSEERT